MKYALLAYDPHGTLDSLPAEEKRTLHTAHRALRDKHQAAASSSTTVIAHYRLRPPRLTTTVRVADGEITRTEGASIEANEALRALYLVESDDPDAILDLVARLPAVDMGATVEVWPLIEANRHG